MKVNAKKPNFELLADSFFRDDIRYATYTQTNKREKTGPPHVY